MDTMVAVSFPIEKVLWVIERYLQINLSKVQITPLYKGRKAEDDITTPEWWLSLAFSGHALLVQLDTDSIVQAATCFSSHQA